MKMQHQLIFNLMISLKNQLCKLKIILSFRNSKTSKFFKIEYEKITESIAEKYKIHTFPTFLVVKDGKILHNTQTETKERFLLLLKKFEI